VDKRAAQEFVLQLDVETIPVCAMCLFDVAWPMSQGRRVHPSTVTRTVRWIWLESEDAFRAALVRARMRELPGAEDALRDLEQHGVRSAVVRAIVVRHAELMAEEIAERHPP
jgi:hypothetical protein